MPLIHNKTKKMKRKITISLSLLIFSMGLLQAQAWNVYNGSQIPTSVAGWEVNADNPGANMAEQIVNDTIYPGNKSFLYIQPDNFRTDGVTPGARRFYRQNFTDLNPEITIVARIKGLAIDSLVGELANFIEYSEFSTTYNVRDAMRIVADDSTIKLDRANVNVHVNADLNQWHTYRITFSAKDSISNVYFDEDATPILTGKSAINGDQNYLRFGDGGSARIGGYTDYFLIDTTGAYAPGEGAAIPAKLIPSNPHLIAKWSFEETVGLVADSGLIGLNGALVDSGSVTRINCGVGQSLNLTNAAKNSARVQVPDNPYIDFDATNSFSISVLAKGDYLLNSVDSWLVAKGVLEGSFGNFGQWYGIEMKYSEIGSGSMTYQLRFIVDDRITKTVAVTYGIDTLWDNNVWHHIVGVRDRAEDSLKLYLDGVLVGSIGDATNSTINTTGQPLIIGNSTNATNIFKGAIDEVAFYNKALTASDVTNLHNSLKTSGDCATTDSLGIIHVSGIEVYSHAGRDTVEVGKQMLIVKRTIPANAYITSAVYNAEPSSIATINKYGNLTGVSPGKVIVTATSDDLFAVKSNDLEITVEAPVSGIESITAQGLIVYPIPASNSLNIQLNDNFMGETLRISDISGREVIKTVVNQNLMTIDVSELNKGIYIVSIKSDSNSTIKQIVIE